MNTAGAIARNTIVQTVGKFVSIALGWAIVLMMTRSLGAAGFGAYTIMTAYLQFFGVAADFGFVLVSSQLLAERPQEEEKIFANLLTFRLVTAAVIIALAPLTIWFFPYTQEVKEGVVVLSFSFFLAALMQVFTGFFQKELKMGRVLGGEIVSRLVLLAFIAYAVSTNAGLTFMLVGVVVGAFANFCILFFSAGRQIRIRFAVDREFWILMWQRSWPLIATIVLNLIYLKADTVILSLTRPEAEVGVYGAMYRVFEVLVTFPTMFAGLLLPILVAARARGEMDQFLLTARRGLDALIYTAVPMVVGVYLVASGIVPLFGADFVEDGPALLRLLVVANAAVFIGTYFAHLVVAVDQQRRMIVPFAITAAVGLVGYLIFIPQYGAYGAAIMTIVAETVIAVFAYIVARRVTEQSFSMTKPFLLALAASVPMAAILFVLSTHVILGMLLGGTAYVLSLYLLGGFPRELLSALMPHRS